jgi:predicted Rossmann-fold nucleotide-binding protein
VILLGDGEWDGLLEWLRARVLAEGRIDVKDLDVLRIVRGPSEVCELVDAARRRLREHGRRQKRRTTTQAAT